MSKQTYSLNNTADASKAILRLASVSQIDLTQAGETTLFVCPPFNGSGIIITDVWFTLDSINEGGTAEDDIEQILINGKNMFPSSSTAGGGNGTISVSQTIGGGTGMDIAGTAGPFSTSGISITTDNMGGSTVMHPGDVLTLDIMTPTMGSTTYLFSAHILGFLLD